MHWGDPNVPDDFQEDTTLSEFLRMPYREFLHPMSRYYRMNQYWSRILPEPRVATIRAEDMRTDQVRVLEYLQSQLQLTPAGEWQTQSKTVWVDAKPTAHNYDKGYFQTSKYREDYSPEDIAWIMQYLFKSMPT